MLRWDTPERLRALLCELVSWESETGSYGEARFPFRLTELLREAPHFREHPARITPTADATNALYATALYRHPDVRDTIVLVSHYDTVDTSEYGALAELACDPERLTAAMLDRADQLEPEAAADATSGAYLFGRGTADMKAGLALHMALLERATAEAWRINLLLLTVADEEVGSAGMRAAVEHLDTLRDEHDLRYVLVLDSEPSFPEHHGDEDRTYVHSGSIGKIMPAAICVGRETHAGIPLDGLTSTYIASWLTREMEWCDEFCEEAHGEATPLPVTLWQRDLRAGYSTKTTSRTSAFYNVFVMQRSAAEVLDRFEAIARRAAADCTREYHRKCAREGVEPMGDIDVLRFEQLVAHARERLGDAVVRGVLQDAALGPTEDAGTTAMRMADALIVLCPELAPAIVVMFAPPYYPPVNSSDDPLVRACIERITTEASARFGRELTQRHWFRAISDLSYVDYAGGADGWQAYERNTPGFGTTYQIPFDAMQRLQAPVLNIGPRGKDLHTRTERVDCRSAFEELPVLLAELAHFVADKGARE